MHSLLRFHDKVDLLVLLDIRRKAPRFNLFFIRVVLHHWHQDLARLVAIDIR